MLPWGAMLRAALAAGIGPEAFWRLSLREWRWLSGGGGDAMDRGGLAALMGAYPDAEESPQDPHLSSPLQGEERRQRLRFKADGGVLPLEKGETEGVQAAGDAHG